MTELDSKYDKILDRPDLPGVEGTKETSPLNQSLYNKRSFLESLEEDVKNLKDDLELNNNKIPQYHLQP